MWTNPKMHPEWAFCWLVQWLGTVLNPLVDLILFCCQHKKWKIVYIDFYKRMWVMTIKMSLGMFYVMRAGFNFDSEIWPLIFRSKPLCRILFFLILNINSLKPMKSNITVSYIFLQEHLHSSFKYILRVWVT